VVVAVIAGACGTGESRSAQDVSATAVTSAQPSTTTTLALVTTTAAPPTLALSPDFVVLISEYGWGASEGVAELQAVLGIAVDGVYGPETRAAHVKALEYVGVTDYQTPLAPWERPESIATTPAVTTTSRAPNYSDPVLSISCGESVTGNWFSYRNSFDVRWGWDQNAGFGSVYIDYGDGRGYTSQTKADAERNAFWHKYQTPGDFRVSAVLTDGSGQAARSSCSWTWTGTSIAPDPVTGPRTGAICRDGWLSSATGSGACSWHGGVSYWLH